MDLQQFPCNYITTKCYYNNFHAVILQLSIIATISMQLYYNSKYKYAFTNIRN